MEVDVDHLRGHPHVMPTMAFWLTPSHVELFVMSCPVLRSFLRFGNKFSSKITKHALE